jgi:hypothetical protein
MFQSNLVTGFLSQLLESTVLLASMNLLFQRDDSGGLANGWPRRLQSGRAHLGD